MAGWHNPIPIGQSTQDPAWKERVVVGMRVEEGFPGCWARVGHSSRILLRHQCRFHKRGPPSPPPVEPTKLRACTSVGPWTSTRTPRCHTSRPLHPHPSYRSHSSSDFSRFSSPAHPPEITRAPSLPHGDTSVVTISLGKGSNHLTKASVSGTLRSKGGSHSLSYSLLPSSLSFFLLSFPSNCI